MIRSIPVLLAFLCFAATAAAQSSAAPAPTTKPADMTMSDVRFQTFKPCNYVYLETETSLKKIAAAIETLMTKLQTAIEDGSIRPSGAVIFAYDGCDGSPDKVFKLQVGIAGEPNPALHVLVGFKTRKIESAECATLLYSGPLKTLSKSFEKLMPEIFRSGRQPASTFREVYLYWEGPDSVNNVVQIQVDLAPKK